MIVMEISLWISRQFWPKYDNICLRDKCGNSHPEIGLTQIRSARNGQVIFVHWLRKGTTLCRTVLW